MDWNIPCECEYCQADTHPRWEDFIKAYHFLQDNYELIQDRLDWYSMDLHDGDEAPRDLVGKFDKEEQINEILKQLDLLVKGKNV